MTGPAITGVSEGIDTTTPFQPINQDPINGVEPIARNPEQTPGFSADAATGEAIRNPATTSRNIDPTTGEATEGLTTPVTPFTQKPQKLSLGGVQTPNIAPPIGGQGPNVGVTPGAPGPGPGGGIPDPPDPPGGYEIPGGEPNEFVGALTRPETRGQNQGMTAGQNQGMTAGQNQGTTAGQNQGSGAGTGDGAPPTNQARFSLPNEAQAAAGNLLKALGTERDTDKINAILQSYLGLQNLGQQDFFNQQFAPTAGTVAGLYNTAMERATSPYELPNVPDMGSAQVYDEGAAGAGQMRNIIDQLARTQAPLDNLSKLAQQTANYMEGRSGDLVNPYRADLDEDFAQAERELESSLAARGMVGSTQADEARRRLRESKARAQADADLKFYQGVGGERRADIELTGGLLGDLFGQQMKGSEFALNRLGAQQGAVGQAEGMDLGRRGIEAQRAQMQYENMVNSLLQRENIDANRLQMMQQPLSMLLSALSGTNVAPGTIGPLQMPRQGPGAGEMFGSALGNLVSNLPMMKKG